MSDQGIIRAQEFDVYVHASDPHATSGWTQVNGTGKGARATDWPAPRRTSTPPCRTHRGLPVYCSRL